MDPASRRVASRSRHLTVFLCGACIGGEEQAQAAGLREELQRLLRDPRMMPGPTAATGVVQAAFAKDVALFM